MSDVTVLSRVQRILVDVASSTVSVINAGPQGPGGPPGVGVSSVNGDMGPNVVFEADDVPYANTTSGLTATDVQAALDELSESPGGVTSVNAQTGDVVLSVVTFGAVSKFGDYMIGPLDVIDPFEDYHAAPKIYVDEAIGLGGLPPGGTTGQVLAKASSVDGDVEWVDQTSGPVAETPNGGDPFSTDTNTIDGGNPLSSTSGTIDGGSV